MYWQLYNKIKQTLLLWKVETAEDVDLRSWSGKKSGLP